ncbi:hypothetical protein D1007_21087 [Hordeum vulgare]|nr:hypothetical protein D1007_21087 [Hordeum vulgare]
MAQAAVEPAASGGAFIGRPAEASRMKRKTPSELRDEQLKRRVSEKVANDQSLPSAAFDRPSTGHRNPEQQKTSKYISTRVTGVFPVKKSRKVGKENCKDALLNNGKAPKSADTVAASQSAESPFPSGDGDSAQLDSSVPSLAEAAKPGFRKAEKRSKNALRSVSELHIGDEKLAGSSKFDMDKVLKGFGARGASGASSGTNIQAGDVPLKSSEVCPSKITIPGKKAPLDLTLKTTLQFVSSSSVKWSFLNSLSTTDVPVLYSPAPFQNGCLHIPEVVICREMRKADSGLASSSVSDGAGEPGSAASDPPPLAAGSMCYSMEIKDAALPPWVVSGVCAAMVSDADRFDLTIATEGSSAALNAALASLGVDARSKTAPAPARDVCEALGVPGAVLVPTLRWAALRGLRYDDRGEYLACTTA